MSGTEEGVDCADDCVTCGALRWYECVMRMNEDDFKKIRDDSSIERRGRQLVK